ncbi:flavoprotein [Terrisporobacter vanillatitrophus]|uniref:flavoprotein n=1 Tax=Terrisporobacter vanillatitrophus TaxID=3058402 RepID=UPI00336653FE
MDSRLSELMEKSIIEYIVERVIEKLQEKNKKAVVLFTGATIGFKQSIESLNKLQQNGWKFDVILSNGARDVLGEDLIKSSLNIDKVINEDDKVDIKALLNDNDLVIIPSLTINSASKIANCISDTLVTNIVSKALMSGKKIIASINACCIDNKERKSIYNDHTTEAYKNTLRNHLEVIKSYGITFTTSENLACKVEKIVLNNNFQELKSQSSKTNLKNQNNNFQRSNSIKIDKTVISRSDIYENKNYNTIIINQKSLITDLARDEAKRHKIKLIKE